MMGKKTPRETREQIEALSREGKTQREIAQLAHVCTETVRTVERKSLGLRQPAKRTRGRLSAREKTRIAKLYETEGKTITDVCNRMRISRGSVAALIARAGLVAGLPKKKILAMRADGWTQTEIARKLRLNYRRTFRFFRAHGFARPRCRRLTAADIVSIDCAILRRDGSASAIARTFSASYRYVLQRAHKLLECEKFLSTCKHPLESYYPSLRPLPAIKRGEMSAQRFVENFFPFQVRSGGVIGDGEIDVAARTLLEAHKLFFGAPQNEGQYLSALRHHVAAHLGLAPTENGWLH